jgi:hypothetical protein
VDLLYTLARQKKIAAQNFYTNLTAINSQKLCSLHSQLAKAAKKRTSKKNIYTIDFFSKYESFVDQGSKWLLRWPT